MDLRLDVEVDRGWTNSVRARQEERAGSFGRATVTTNDAAGICVMCGGQPWGSPGYEQLFSTLLLIVHPATASKQASKQQQRASQQRLRNRAANQANFGATQPFRYTNHTHRTRSLSLSLPLSYLGLRVLAGSSGEMLFRRFRRRASTLAEHKILTLDECIVLLQGVESQTGRNETEGFPSESPGRLHVPPDLSYQHTRYSESHSGRRPLGTLGTAADT